MKKNNTQFSTPLSGVPVVKLSSLIKKETGKTLVKLSPLIKKVEKKKNFYPVNIYVKPGMPIWEKYRLLNKVKGWETHNPGGHKEIVVWGKYLESGLGQPKVFKDHVYLSYGLPKEKFSMIIGMLLGDGWASMGRKTINTNARIGFKQSMVHFDSFLNAYLKLSHYCGSLPHSTKNILRGKLFHGVQLQTRAMPCFTKIYYMFYKNGKKIVPKGIIKYLNPICLTQWLEDDGSVQKAGNLILCTDNFTLSDVKLLINALTKRYGFSCKIIQRDKTKEQYRINISKNSMDKLRSVVKNHISESMKYKVHL